MTVFTGVIHFKSFYPKKCSITFSDCCEDCTTLGQLLYSLIPGTINVTSTSSNAHGPHLALWTVMNRPVNGLKRVTVPTPFGPHAEVSVPGEGVISCLDRKGSLVLLTRITMLTLSLGSTTNDLSTGKKAKLLAQSMWMC